MKKIIAWGVCFIVICGIGAYLYKDNVDKNNFQIQDYGETGGDEILWTDNSKYNKYDIKFGVLNGSDTKKVISKKNTYDMKINVDAESGDLGLKIYNNNKVLFQNKGSIGKNITIDQSDNKDVKIELSGKNAKGHVTIRLS